jgi:TM2 domain-containing membrane protein YozV
MSLSQARTLPIFLLCLLFGWCGVHRFYLGKLGTGLLQLFTLGALGIWWCIDLYLIITGNFTDRDGQKITQWT